MPISPLADARLAQPDVFGAVARVALPLPDIDQRVVQALTVEVMLTPKPGLVDRANNGAHHDMDVPLFQKSIRAMTPWLRRFIDVGYEHADASPKQLLAQVRPVGIACEQAMLAATQGVNTHKGGIFACGLLCSAAGWLAANGVALTQRSLCQTVADMCRDLVRDELFPSRRAATAGEQLFQRYGLTGARGEAASGFQTVTRLALPAYRQALSEYDREMALLHTLVVLMAHNPDTNIVSRGGMEGLAFVQRYAADLLAQGVTIPRLQAMDRALTARHLSPGGTADLLALTWLLHHYPAE
ncbi:triphosphoribosyl-dephospho-CoA synthase [Lonsdalea populi]|uniref:Probable 2-(5''-triphosphoribosyl)-3'-dephosphocoenzyme-A synthase n=1 Tax=Lonsdalea populi TaxID=1172565 RepID=A0A3N0UJB8_9GAMM|nr:MULTISPECIES: triphosphoribosyl-dephospho-CoA synthase CitG [Lonsdalea]RAT18001.1 triphosphoribosyl-dephospho-CoA synthase [Lonsdalea quercina]RAT29552.1 triphosphoribosyl-dephospho-CoA synthase [Lonsdalea populi]RAT39489.1 triphosphoribosyl-dephospho-CoA synthase [Lonsdalea populi]RAT46249.1 triphosphoribosyl-dephospho-CoA synthase [Lonsdalea populi]RAT54548.1 triphosphoribosyl-dephospho-CoA synthase [Lonsdalea populi]